MKVQFKYLANLLKGFSRKVEMYTVDKKKGWENEVVASADVNFD